MFLICCNPQPSHDGEEPMFIAFCIRHRVILILVGCTIFAQLRALGNRYPLDRFGGNQRKSCLCTTPPGNP
jgi:hypothetical protein